MLRSQIEIDERDRPVKLFEDFKTSQEGGRSPPIYFYYPRRSGIGDADIPESRGEFARNRPGNYIWTVKTYGYLSKMGFPCRLTHELPDEGIILTHREFFTN